MSNLNQEKISPPLPTPDKDYEELDFEDIEEITEQELKELGVENIEDGNFEKIVEKVGDNIESQLKGIEEFGQERIKKTIQEVGVSEESVEEESKVIDFEKRKGRLLKRGKETLVRVKDRLKNILKKEEGPSYISFDPEEELEEVKKITEGDFHIDVKEDKLREYKKNLMEQKEGIANLQLQIRKKMEKSRNVSEDDLIEFVERQAAKLRLTDKHKKTFREVIGKFRERNEKIRDLRKEYKNDEELFKACLGISPKGKVEVVEGPVSFYFRLFQPEDFIAVSVKEDMIYAEPIYKERIEKIKSIIEEDKKKFQDYKEVFNVQKQEVEEYKKKVEDLDNPTEEDKKNYAIVSKQFEDLMKQYNEAELNYEKNKQNYEEKIKNIELKLQGKNVFDISKAASFSGLVPEYSLIEGLKGSLIIENSLGISKKSSKRTRIHEEQHVVYGLFQDYQFKQNLEYPKNHKDIKEVLLEYLRLKAQKASDRIKDEVLAFYKEGQETERIKNNLQQKEYDVGTSVGKRLNRELSKSDNQIVKEIKDEVIDQVFNKEYKSKLDKGINAISKLEEMGKSRDKIVELLMLEPINKWPNIVRHLKSVKKDEKELSKAT